MTVPADGGARALAWAAGAVLVLGACGSGGAAGTTADAAGVSTKAAPTRRPAAASPVGPEVNVAAAPGTLAEGDSAHCPHDGRWRQCSVRDRLVRAGFVPLRQPSPARVPLFSVPGVTYTLGHGELQTFVYANPATLARDLAALDTVQVVPRTGRFAWPAPATLVHSANLLAVFLGPNARQIERVQLALEAGPPPVERPRPGGSAR